MLPIKKSLSSKPLRLLLTVIVLAIVIVLLGVFGVIGPDKSDSAAKQQELSDKYNTYDAVKNPNKHFNLVVNAQTHQLQSGPSVIKLTEGDVVDIHVLSMGDPTDESHINLEGYDVTTEAGNDENSSGDLMFAAYKTGTFKISDLGDETAAYPAGQYVIATVEVAKK